MNAAVHDRIPQNSEQRAIAIAEAAALYQVMNLSFSRRRKQSGGKRIPDKKFDAIGPQAVIGGAG